MERTARHLEDIRNIMNTSPVIQNQMDTLAEKAVAMNMSKEQWESFKVAMLNTMLYKMAEMIPEIKQDMAADIYEELRK